MMSLDEPTDGDCRPDGYSRLFSEEIPDYDNTDDDLDVIITRTIDEEESPPDRFRLVQITFILLGMAPILPWNFFITATDYWMYKFRHVNRTGDLQPTDKTDLQTYFNSYLSMSSNIPFLFVLTATAVIGHRIDEEVRNLASLITIILAMMATTILVEVDTDSWQGQFLTSTLVIVVLISLFAGLLQGSVTGLASLFPRKAMHSIVIGQALAGIFAVVAQILSLAGHWTPINSGFYYFVSADFTLIVTIIMYVAIHRTEYYEHHVKLANGHRRQLRSMTEASLDERRSRHHLIDVLVTIWPQALTVMLVFWVTLSLFPAVAVLVVARHPDASPWTGRYFLPVACFLLFNCSDLAGRLTGRFLPLPDHHPKLVLCFSVVRIFIVPLMMLCNAYPRQHLPVVFENEAVFIVLMTLLGLSNGYLFTNAMVSGPAAVREELRESAGFVLTAFLGLGLTLGSVTSNLVIRML